MIISDGQIINRYLKTSIEFSGDKAGTRVAISNTDIKMFYDNLFTGVGPGMSPKVRNKYGHAFAASHTEYTRLLSEHGLLGLIAMVIMIIYPTISFIVSKSNEQRFMLIVFLVLALLTMSHSAMRLAMPGFIYGISLLILKKENSNDQSNFLSCRMPCLC